MRAALSPSIPSPPWAQQNTTAAGESTNTSRRSSRQMRCAADALAWLCAARPARNWQLSDGRRRRTQDALKSGFRFIRTEEDDACAPQPSPHPVFGRPRAASRWMRCVWRLTAVSPAHVLCRREGTWEQRLARKYYDKLFKARGMHARTCLEQAVPAIRERALSE